MWEEDRRGDKGKEGCFEERERDGLETEVGKKMRQREDAGCGGDEERLSYKKEGEEGAIWRGS